MGALGIVLLLVAILGLVALLATERRTWEGLAPAFTVAMEKGGRGEVVRTAPGPQKGEAFLSRRLARGLAVALGLTALLLALAAFFEPFSLTGTLSPSLDGILVIAAMTALGQEEGSAWRSFGWALAGYVLTDAVVTVGCMAAGLESVGLLNGLGMTVGSLGCALAVAVFVPQRTFLRQFQDGSKSPVRVGSFSAAARALEAKVDPSFQASPAEFENALSHDFVDVKPKGGTK